MHLQDVNGPDEGISPTAPVDRARSMDLGAVCGESRTHGSEGGRAPRGADLSHLSTEENKAVVRRFYEECNRGKEAAIAALEELCAPDYVWHSPSPGVLPDVDLAGAKQVLTAFFTAFPDAHYTLEDLIAEGDKVVHRFTFRGTH